MKELGRYSSPSLCYARKAGQLWKWDPKNSQLQSMLTFQCEHQQNRNLKKEAAVEIKYDLDYMVESDECHGKKLGIKDYEDGSRRRVKDVRKVINQPYYKCLKIDRTSECEHPQIWVTKDSWTLHPVCSFTSDCTISDSVLRKHMLKWCPRIKVLLGMLAMEHSYNQAY